MNVIVLKPKYNRTEYSLMVPGEDAPLSSGVIENMSAEFSAPVFRNSAAVIVLPYGGSIFKTAVAADEKALKKLAGLSHCAPLHIPAAIRLVKILRAEFSDIPAVFCFQTSYFVRLPLREKSFAISRELSEAVGAERYGFHGLLHEAAVQKLSMELRREKIKTPHRIVSICLEPRPEVAAVIGRTPVMVTSDATPLGGICGERTPGEMDPTIILILMNKHGYSPERINEILTRESGIAGFCGKEETIASVLSAKTTGLPGKIIRYQLLKALGAGAAAMGGLDGMVFSGRYSGLYGETGEWLLSKFFKRNPSMRKRIKITAMDKTAERIAADTAAAVIRRKFQIDDGRLFI